MAEIHTTTREIDEIVANVEKKRLAEKPTEEATVEKARGASILLGKKPKYQSRSKAKAQVVPALAEQMQLPKREDLVNPLLKELKIAEEKKKEKELEKEKEVEPEPLSLDEQLKLKALERERREIEEKRLAEIAKAEEDARIAADSHFKIQPPKKRISIRDQMRASHELMNVNPDDVSEDKLAEDLGTQFQGLWGKLGMAANFTKKIKDEIVEVASRVHPHEVLERVTSQYPKRRYRPVHHSLGPIVDHEKHLSVEGGEHLEDKEKEEDKTDTTVNDDALLPASEVRRRRGGFKKIDDNLGANPFHMLELTQDELDYFYGAFCDAAGAGPDDPEPEQITLGELVDWFYKVEYRFKTKDLKRDNKILVENIRTVHYFDDASRVKAERLNDSLMMQPKTTKEGEEVKLKMTEAEEETERLKQAVKDANAGRSPLLTQKREVELSREQEEQLLKAKDSGDEMTSMTFIDFVLCMWNFLSADEVMMSKNLWEYIEVGLLKKYECKGIISFEFADELVSIWHEKSKGKMKKNNNKRKKNKASLMKDALEKDAHRVKDAKGMTISKSLYFGNFRGLCENNRGFTFGCTQLQLDMMACLMGSSFWKRQKTFRQKKFGLANLHYILRGDHMSYNVTEPMDEADLQKLIDNDLEYLGVETKGAERDGGGEDGEGTAEGEEGLEEDEEQHDEDENEDPETLKEKQLKEKRATVHRKVERIRLGKTILMIEMKKGKGEKLSGEESWLLAKATAQAKTANKVYMRMSKTGDATLTRKIGKTLKRAIAEEEEEDAEAEAEAAAAEEAEAIKRARKEKVKRMLEAEQAKQGNIGGFKEEQKAIYEKKQAAQVDSKYAKYVD
ncbi:hypothetical protein TL16_g02090 [Triparma laevis f. inornata]|uniref:Uncharacterized protein n=1 Tax=Triparma laevis f. inornata TaxID=1714386 RepID=A0A9W6ZKH2_9STRA|nr:hypothetical protein TL16_g02090 [Triparma laevis f. inornata]